MCYEGGIREFVTFINENKTPVHDEVIYMAGEKADAMAEIAHAVHRRLQRDHRLLRQQHSHPRGRYARGRALSSAMTTVLNAYGKKMKILKDDEKVSGDDCREGLTCVISVKLTEAQFEGQTKAKLGNSRDPHTGEQPLSPRSWPSFWRRTPPWARRSWKRP